MKRQLVGAFEWIASEVEVGIENSENRRERRSLSGMSCLHYLSSRVMVPVMVLVSLATAQTPTSDAPQGRAGEPPIKVPAHHRRHLGSGQEVHLPNQSSCKA